MQTNKQNACPLYWTQNTRFHRNIYIDTSSPQAVDNTCKREKCICALPVLYWHNMLCMSRHTALSGHTTRNGTGRVMSYRLVWHHYGQSARSGLCSSREKNLILQSVSQSLHFKRNADNCNWNTSISAKCVSICKHVRPATTLIFLLWAASNMT